MAGVLMSTATLDAIKRWSFEIQPLSRNQALLIDLAAIDHRKSLEDRSLPTIQGMALAIEETIPLSMVTSETKDSDLEVQGLYRCHTERVSQCCGIHVHLDASN